MKCKAIFGLVRSVCVVIIGCKAPQQPTKDYNKPLPPGEYALRKITDPAMIPDITFACYETKDMRDCIDRSLSYLSKPSSQQFFPMGDITHERTVASLKALGKLLDSGVYGRDLKAAIMDQFEFYQSVGCDNFGTVLFTGYYTPIFDGSLTATEKFKYPLYRQPQDLVKGPNGEILGQQMPDGTTRPYPARKEIEQSGMMKGQEIAWLSDPFEVYIAHVQGSAILRLADGKEVTFSYSANNGHEYKSVGQQMIQDNVMPSESLSLKAMIEYFKANPQQVDKYVNQNPRFVFFRSDSGTPRGCLNECVTEKRTIATDKSIYPRAAISIVKTNLPRETGGTIRKTPYTAFGLDQDAGGAIRAPGRCDVYMGIGDKAGQMAGQVYEEGKLYYIFIKPSLMKTSVPGPTMASSPAPAEIAPAATIPPEQVKAQRPAELYVQ